MHKLNLSQAAAAAAASGATR